MLSDALSTVSWRARPRSFVALMSLYESNYIRFGWLAGEPRALGGRYCSAGWGDCDLVLTVVERSPYTTSLNLTYLMSRDAGDPGACPDMGVRLYHDARLAEAQDPVPARGAPLKRSPRARAERELHQRWTRNVMLNKWLEYCVERGHRFSPAARIP